MTITMGASNASDPDFDEYLADHFLGGGGRVPNQSGWWLIPDGPSPPRHDLALLTV